MAKDQSPEIRDVNGYKHGRVPREVRRTQLLELAEELFMEKGYGGFSIDDLCRAAGVSRPIVYEHFGSKDGIYIACLQRIRAEFEGALLAAAANGADLATTVERSAEAWFSILQREPPHRLDGKDPGEEQRLAQARAPRQARVRSRLRAIRRSRRVPTAEGGSAHPSHEQGSCRIAAPRGRPWRMLRWRS